MCCPSGRAVGTIPTANACVPPGVQVSGGTSKFAHGVADSTVGESTKRRGGGQHWAESAARGLRAAGGRFQESLPACGREAGPTKSTQVTWVDPEPGLGLGGHPGLFVCCQTQAAPGPATAVCGPLPPRPTLTLHKTRPPFSFLYTYPTCHRPSAYLECRRHLCP